MRIRSTQPRAEPGSGPSARPSLGPPRRSRLAAAFAVVLILAVLAAACGDGSSTTSASGSGAAGNNLSIRITQPADGADVTLPFDVALDSSVPVGKPDTGLHHIHIYYDGNTNEGDYDIVYSVDKPWTVERSLEPGEHTIEAVIANADHSLTDARQEITVNVTGAAEGGGATTTTDGGGGPYGY